MAYFRSINQQVQVSLSNTDSSNLAVNQVYSGSATSTLGVNSIQVNLKADQNCIIYVDQGPADGTWNIQDSFNYYNNGGGIGFTTQATDAYTRVRVKNVGTASTTTKILSTVLCPIVEALPRALSDEGNLKTAIYEIESNEFNTPSLVSPMRELKTVQSFRLVGISLSGSTVDTNFWTVATTGSGTVTQVNGELVLADGTTASSAASVSSKRRARYVPVTTNYYRGLVTCPTQSGSCIRRWGAYDSSDGYIYQYDGTNLNLLTRKNGIDSTITNGTFNGSFGLAYNQKINDGTCVTYEIFWTNRATHFLIGDELLHKATGVTTPLVATPHLSASADCSNGTGNTANNSMNIRTQSILRLGEASTAPIYAYAITSSATPVTLKNSPGRLQRIVINSLGVGANILTLYDSTTNTNPFAVFSTSATSSFGPIEYSLDFYNGLSYVLNGGTGAANVTIIYE